MSLKNNATTDSYNSAVGPYSVSKQNSGGDLGTNSIVSGAIELKNNSVVNGDIIVGVGGASTVVDADQNAVYGIIEAENVPFPDTPAIPPTGTSLGNINVPNKGNVTINPGIYSNLNIGGKSTLNLNAGSYVFNNISGSQNITINALTKPVVIYFTGSVDLTNNVTINNNGIPKDLIFLGTSTATSFNFKNNAVSFFGLYAPTADIVFENNGELYGSFVGKTMIAENNTDIHFDRNMNVNIPGLPAYVTVDKISRW